MIFNFVKRVWEGLVFVMGNSFGAVDFGEIVGRLGLFFGSVKNK